MCILVVFVEFRTWLSVDISQGW